MNKTLVNIVKYILFLCLGVGLLWLVFRKEDPNKILNDIQQANWYWILVSLLIGFVSVWLRAKRWIQMLEPLGYKPSMLNAFCSVTIGYMVNYGVPRAGEVTRCAMLYKSDGVPVEKSLGAVVTERIIDMMILMLLVMMAFVLQFDKLVDLIADMKANSSAGGSGLLGILIYIFLALVVLGIVLFFVFRNKIKDHKLYIKIAEILKGFVVGLSSFSKVKNKFLFLVYSFGIWICYLMMMYTSFFSLAATSHLGLIESITIQAVGTFGYVVPVPGGIGAFHYFTTMALSIFDIAESDGKTYATIVHESQMLMFMVSGIISFIIMGQRIKKRNDRIADTI